MKRQHKQIAVVISAAILCFACNPEWRARKKVLREMSCPVYRASNAQGGSDFAFAIGVEADTLQHK